MDVLESNREIDTQADGPISDGAQDEVIEKVEAHSDKVAPPSGEAGEPDAVNPSPVNENDSQEYEEARQIAENNALARVFDDVRSQSKASALVQPGRWEEMGLVPEHLTPEDFEMLVYDYLQDHAADEDPEEPRPVHRSATRMVGVPQTFAPETTRTASPAVSDVSEQYSEQSSAFVGTNNTTTSAECDNPSNAPEQDGVSSHEACAESSNRAAADAPDAICEDDQDLFSRLDLPEGYQLVELEGEFVLVPDEKAARTPRPINCKHIAMMIGTNSYYLYDKESMTDAYAHWSFLAAEDDKVATFVDCVREDSRIYPRPLAATSFYNAPLNFTEEDVDRTWDMVKAAETYQDIQRTIASNGDVYYFSTHYLSPSYAASLAQWDAVSRKMYL